MVYRDEAVEMKNEAKRASGATPALVPDEQKGAAAAHDGPEDMVNSATKALEQHKKDKKQVKRMKKKQSEKHKFNNIDAIAFSALVSHNN